jgi:hypothetical protein
MIVVVFRGTRHLARKHTGYLALEASVYIF